MKRKVKLRKKYLKLRKNKYFEINDKFFKIFLLYLKKFFKKKSIFLSLYYPSNYEVNTLKVLNLIKNRKDITPLLPCVYANNKMSFHKWNYLDVLKVNKHGMLEPYANKKPFVPNVILLPLLSYDKNNHRLGYGKGYYDKFLNKYLKKNKNILTVGVAFSFQKYDKLPISNHDVRLDCILTEKGIQKAWIY